MGSFSRLHFIRTRRELANDSTEILIFTFILEIWLILFRIDYYGASSIMQEAPVNTYEHFPNSQIG